MQSNKHQNLPIPVYLNQQMVFDLLAIKDDGFSMMYSIKTASSDEKSREKAIEGGIGISNVFALLGVQFSSKKGETSSEAVESATEKEKVHTPNSLFAKLRQTLLDESIVSSLSDISEFESLKVGQFVEMDVTLAKSPIIATLENFIEMMKISVLFGDPKEGSSKHSGSKNSKKSNQKSETKEIEGLLRGLQLQHAIQLIGSLTSSPKIQVAMSTKSEFFLDQDITEVFDGEFRILGKITKIVNDGDEPINLLKRTTFSLMRTMLAQQFVTMFQNTDDQAFEMLDLPPMQLEIQSPAIQLIPIAIFR